MEIAQNHFEAEYRKANTDMPFKAWLQLRLDNIVERLKAGVKEFTIDDCLVLYADKLKQSSGSSGTDQSVEETG